MQKRLEEYGKTIEITGFRNIHIRDAKFISQTLTSRLNGDCEIQFFDADLVATWQHLYFAVLNAIMNLRSSRRISKSIAVETVLYACAQKQIQKAIDIIGLKPNCENAALVVICEDEASATAGLDKVSKFLGSMPDDSVLELSKLKIERIRKAFDITQTELTTASASGVNEEQALVDLVVERVALLSTRL
ncbi:MAG TPA: KEOPS complex subunit Cgi121 [Candidatus Nanoarchaeia archaeon]|nr:KEOPS complex subunit Cgi121 [Candidatus Nanoarchaeia archaeon]